MTCNVDYYTARAAGRAAAIAAILAHVDRAHVLDKRAAMKGAAR